MWSLHESEPWRSYYNHLSPDIARTALSSFAHPYRIVFTARSTLEAWRELESRKNFELIRFALDTDRFQAELATSDRKLARQALRLEDQDVGVLLLGTVCERKAQHDLLNAYAALPAEVARKTRCLVVGARESLAYSRDLRQAAAVLPTDRRDRFQIFDETGDTVKYWLAADIFCCTSRIESYPHVILEAMYSGLPIITTPVFGISEQVRPGINALFYPPGDIPKMVAHLKRLVQEDGYRQSLAETSQWVLRGLPTFREMDEKYRDVFAAASESAVLASSESERQVPSSLKKKATKQIGKAPHRLPSVAHHGGMTAPRKARSSRFFGHGE